MLRRVLLAAAVVALCAPATAAATTYTVDAKNGHDDCSANACKTFAEAAAKVADGDSVSVQPGVYQESSPVTFTKKVAISATPYAAYLTSQSSSQSPLLTMSGTGSSVDGLIVAPSATQGPALGITASTTVTRCQLLAKASAASAISIAGTAGSTTPVAVTLDSDIAVPGSGGTAIDAVSASGTTAAAQAGPAITIKGTHVTAAGGAKPVALHATAVLTGTSGSLDASFDQSILHGSAASTVTLDASPNPLGSAAKGSLTETKSDASDSSGANISVTGGQRHSDADVFAGSTYHLKVGSPDIDQGSAADPSATDVDGGPRQVGPASDLGADEFSDNAPTAVLTVSGSSTIPGQPVTADLSKSSDPDAALGDTISYLINFGDGTLATTPTADHAYSTPGTYTIKAAVYDRSNELSTIQTATVTVKDGTAPQVRIVTPTTNKVFSLKTTKGKPRQVAIDGLASDESGIAKVELSLRRVSLIKTKKAKAKKAKAAASAACTYLLDGKRQIGTATCSKPPFFTVALTKDGFKFKTKSDAGLKAGVYEATARATDKNGNVATSVPVRFTLR